jgi:hypothetical protein
VPPPSAPRWGSVPAAARPPVPPCRRSCTAARRSHPRSWPCRARAARAGDRRTPRTRTGHRCVATCRRGRPGRRNQRVEVPKTRQGLGGHRGVNLAGPGGASNPVFVPPAAFYGSMPRGAHDVAHRVEGAGHQHGTGPGLRRPERLREVRHQPPGGPRGGTRRIVQPRLQPRQVPPAARRTGGPPSAPPGPPPGPAAPACRARPCPPGWRPAHGWAAAAPPGPPPRRVPASRRDCGPRRRATFPAGRSGRGSVPPGTRPRSPGDRAGSPAGAPSGSRGPPRRCAAGRRRPGPAARATRSRPAAPGHRLSPGAGGRWPGPPRGAPRPAPGGSPR